MKLVILFILAFLTVALARPQFGVVKYDSSEEGPRPGKNRPDSSNSSESKESSEETTTFETISTTDADEVSVETSTVEGIEEGSGEEKPFINTAEMLS